MEKEALLVKWNQNPLLCVSLEYILATMGFCNEMKENTNVKMSFVAGSFISV